MDRSTSSALIQRARQSIPGGVNSPVRAFKGVGGDPVFFTRGKGPYLYDADDNEYIDYVASWGPMLLGHAHQPTVDAVVSQAQQSLGFGAPTEGEILLAERIIELIPSMEQVRMVNSGTEATMSAIRLARGFTGRELIVKFAGCYHGHSDSLLVKAGSGLLTLGIPNSPGVPSAIAASTLTVPFNDLDAVQQVLAQYSEQIACIILEPVAGNMGCIPPLPGFLEGLRTLCTDSGTLLIFDEVMTGFRVSLGGAQAVYDITPDMTTLGKIVGGGLPVGAFGGRRDIMAHIAPEGPVYQAGTLSGNPLAVAAGLTMLNHLDAGLYQQLTDHTRMLIEGLHERATAAGFQTCYNYVCGMFGLFFGIDKAENYEDVAASDVALFNRFFHGMLDEGVYLAPSAYETGFVSTTHDNSVIAETLSAAERVFTKLRSA